MSDETWCRDRWGDFKDWVLGVIIALAAVLIICVIVVLAFVGTYAAQGCLINKGHIAPHILDGRYEYQITKMTFPRSEDPTCWRGHHACRSCRRWLCRKRIGCWFSGMRVIACYRLKERER